MLLTFIMNTNELRTKYLKYFETKRHEIIASASLLPENDPTTLFTGSGMQPMVPYLLGESHPKGTRIVDSQKCFRAQDIDEVGDNRHTTFFEMLGNWSLGDYFKKEQIEWMAGFIFDELGLDPKRVYITCFRGNEMLGIPKDSEAAELWQAEYAKRGLTDTKIIDFAERNGMQGGNIFYYDESKNWWSRSGKPANMPEGEPGGPDTEMFWDFAPEQGAQHLHGDIDNETWGDVCHVNCDCGRFMEIGNNVFMEYQKTADGFAKLPQQNVDFGGGLERIMAAKINNPDVFMIDIFDEIRESLQKLSDKTYGENEADTYAFRVVMDHLRAAVHLISDEAFPSNKDQGYFTRRLIRRAVRFASNLGIEENFIGAVAESVIKAYEGAYPALRDKADTIIKAMEEEEKKFRKALARGEKEYKKVENDILAALDAGGAKQTKITKIGTKINVANIDYQALAKIAFDLFQTHGLPVEVFSDFITKLGYDYDEMELLAAFDEHVKGHQELSRKGAEQKFKGGLADHSDMSVKYHTATHLLHIALRKVLGEHVQQKGSNITPKRLRFDFSHPDKMTDEEIDEVTRLVNGAIAHNYSVSFEEIPVDDAYKQGVIGFFPDKYDDVVKVYTIGDPAYPGNANPDEPTFSREICGGPHVEHTGHMGTFIITKEEACSAGVRRIKAVLK